MSTKINSHGLHASVLPVQFTDGGALIDFNQGNWATSSATNQNLSTLSLPVINSIGGVLGMGYGGYLAKQGISETIQAARCGDANGILTGSLNAGIGATFVGMSGAATANGILGALPVFELMTETASNALIKIFTTAMNWLGLGLYSFYIGGALASLPDLRAFSNGFHEMLDTQRICAKTKALECLRFLESQISLTPEEQANLSPESAEKALQVKWDRLVRSVGLKCAQKIEQELKPLLQEVRNGKVENAQKLIETVNRAHFKQKVTQMALFAAGIIGVFGSALTLLSLGGYAGFVLFASASILYWLNDAIGDIAYKALGKSREVAAVFGSLDGLAPA